MKRMHKRWTDQEDDIVYKEITENALNIRKTIRGLSVKLDRSISSIEFRWYGVLQNPSHPKYRGTKCFMTICKKQALANKKIFTENSVTRPIKVKVSIWRKILNLFK